MRKRTEEIYEISDKEHNTITFIYVFAKPKKVGYNRRKVYFLVQGIIPFKELKELIKIKNKELYEFIQEHENEYCQIHVNISGCK